jgi:hypothetical protein
MLKKKSSRKIKDQFMITNSEELLQALTQDFRDLEKVAVEVLKQMSH